MTINEILIFCIDKLKEKGIEEPILKAKMLVSYHLNQKKEYLIIKNTEKINVDDIEKIKKNLNRLIEGVPIQYITNKQEFMGIDFFVNENVLIPQPDTEILVEEVINLAKKIKANKLLDLCTGSGAIAISIAKNTNIREIVASDISKKALQVARKNCKANKTENIELMCSDLFKNINKKFNIIACNPPYIKTDIIGTLSIEVKNEPYIALNGGQDGLDFYRKIINQAYNYLENEGLLCLEIGYDQKDEIISIIKSNGKYNNIYSKKDLSGNDRIIVCKKE